MRSASTTVTPRRANASATADLPLPMPPVRPTLSMDSVCGADAEIRSDQRLTPHQRDPARRRQEWAEGYRHVHMGDAFQAQERETHRGTDGGGQQDHHQELLPPEPGPDEGVELEIPIAHAFLAGGQLEQMIYEPQRQITCR